MTAEVAIVNRNAVALAADSAVTVTKASGEQKIYNSVEKLFRLSEKQPIALMIYGTGSFAMLGWELYAKAFRKANSSTLFETMEDCCNAFFKFLESSTHISTIQERNESTLGFIASQCRLLLSDTLKAFENQKTFTDDEFLTAFVKGVSDEIRLLTAENFRIGINEDSEEKVFQRIEQIIKPITAEYFGTSLNEEAEKKLCRYITLFLTRSQATNASTGVVLAGFGEKEFKPSVHSYLLLTALDDFLFYQRNESLSHNSTGGATVIPFAQADVIHSFIRGMAPAARVSLESISRHVTFETRGKLMEALERNFNLSEESKDELTKLMVEGRSETLKQLDSKLSEDLVDPIVSMLEFLPKSELATMAESLINMTAFRRKVSHHDESVGGPVDVAVLSKNDGFVWVKRKHYFPQQFNDHFFNCRKGD